MEKLEGKCTGLKLRYADLPSLNSRLCENPLYCRARVFMRTRVAEGIFNKVIKALMRIAHSP